ncbi:hypothetical protein BD289DRAFT_374671 [Coniella lustricola]|uniref:ferroxidase n=1 Tax=Coniella lustricola TaxID=2025994 RepID=A0A2T2ZZE0_9PEZI|nr:hypothetical protein BD289DRAFT_374671 [Coniella lustricola]
MPATATSVSQSRFLSFSSRQAKGILPDSDNPAPPIIEEDTVKPVLTELSDQEYHDLADEFLLAIQDRLEEVAEKNDQVDVEYAAGVLNVTFPEIGTYVINKQPPNKQIWLSSPISGPKRYDYVVYGEGQAHKEDTAVGDWVYLRDGSTIKSLFLDELNVNLTLPLPQ